ncbi:GMC family oxidoreductase [Bradyrhizobium arachidis]|uniref:GMC family oxidoreductase n=1 Tax=Bradyrhizobium arachidis TaxID=858423 RepID=UPI0024BFEAB5|nr:GMC family oxidoreductase [Bradyrhizobium arachidis]
MSRWHAEPRPPGFLIRNQNSQYRLAYHAEHLPNQASRVTLTGEVDRLGMNRIAIDLRFTEADAASLERLHQRMSEWLKRGSLARLVLRCNPSDQQKTALRQAKDGTHQLGMTRMASSANDGVADRNLRAFGIANLYLCSTSVLPTSSQANPTLIVVALALRLSHHIARLFKWGGVSPTEVRTP